MSPAFIAILVPAIFAAVVSLVIRQVKRQKKALSDALRRHGFTPLERLDDAELATVQKLRRVTSEDVGVNSIYEYRHLDYRLLRFDITSKNSDNQNSTAYAIVDARLGLPRFSVAPNIELPGFLNALLGKLIQRIMSRAGLSEVKLPGSPQFSQKYMLLAAGDGAELGDGSLSLWDRVAGIPHHLMINAEGNMVLYQRLEIPGRHNRRARRPDVDEQIRIHLEVGEQLHSILSDAFTLRRSAPTFSPR
jgi:hypothetical protein